MNGAVCHGHAGGDGGHEFPRTVVTNLGLENRDQAKESLQKPLEALDDMAKEG